MLLTTLMLTAASAADDPCAVPAGPDAQVCHATVGHCTDVEIDGQRAEALKHAALRARLTEQVNSRRFAGHCRKRPWATSISSYARTNTLQSSGSCARATKSLSPAWRASRFPRTRASVPTRPCTSAACRCRPPSTSSTARLCRAGNRHYRDAMNSRRSIATSTIADAITQAHQFFCARTHRR
jgi:hypothetical protein